MACSLVGHHAEVQYQFKSSSHYKATSAAQMDGSMGEWYRTTIGVTQVCLLSPTFFNIFLERIMSDAPENMTERLA